MDTKSDSQPKHRTARASVIDKLAFEPDARSRAILRGVQIAEADLRASGGAFDLQAVRTLLRGVSRQRIDKQVREGSLLAVPGRAIAASTRLFSFRLTDQSSRA